MISFNKPNNLDGAKLIAELEESNVEVKPNSIGVKCPVIDGNGVLWLDIKSADQVAAQAVLDNHLGQNNLYR